jgi:hypothetical protein
MEIDKFLEDRAVPKMKFMELYPNEVPLLSITADGATVPTPLFDKMLNDLIDMRAERKKCANAINTERLNEYLKSLSKHDLLVVSNEVNKLMKRSLGPTIDAEVRLVWREAGRLFAIKTYHFNEGHAVKPKLQDSIAYVEALCHDIIPFRRAD